MDGMVNVSLANSIIFFIILLTIAAGIVLFFLFLIFGKLSEKGIFCKMKLRSIFLWSSLCTIIIFISFIFFINIFAKISILNILNRLKSSSKLIIEASPSKIVDIKSEKITLIDKGLIEIISNKMNSLNYSLEYMPGKIATNEYIHIYIFNDDLEKGSFLITGNFIFLETMFFRYSTSNRNLMSDVRNILGINEN